jgi:hypothetical protein
MFIFLRHVTDNIRMFTFQANVRNLLSMWVAFYYHQPVLMTDLQEIVTNTHGLIQFGFLMLLIKCLHVEISDNILPCTYNCDVRLVVTIYRTPTNHDVLVRIAT